MKLNMNLANEFNKILEEYGRDVLLLRNERKLYCECYNEVTQEANRNCPLCLGLGFSFVAERQRMRSESAIAAIQLPNSLKGVSIGEIATGTRQYFLKPNIPLNEKDMIIEVNWDEFGRPSYNGNGMWRISHVDKNQMLGDQEIYRVCYANETPVRANIRSIRISELNGIKQYNVIMEG